MPNEEKKVKAPRDFTEEEKAMLLKSRVKKERKMREDPEYRKEREKRMKRFSTFLGDSIED